MAGLIEYLEWRGDISFAQVKPCEADYAVLGCISYLPYEKLVVSNMNGRPVKAGRVFEKILQLCGPKGDGRTYHLKDDEALTRKLLDSPRFSELELVGYENIIDEEKEEQFAAITMIMPDRELVVLFRGTDKTLVGWKEDFNMGFSDTVPSQHDALRYLESAAKVFGRKMYVCGHSKGGNLAMYASAYSKPETQALIHEIVNLDGPGFDISKSDGNDMRKIRGRLHTYLPQKSIVGMLLEHGEESTIVHSNASMAWQHSPHSWEVRRGRFIREENMGVLSRKIDGTLKDWVTKRTPEQREKLVEGYWRVITETGAKRVDELFSLKNAFTLLKGINSIDEETRELLSESLKLFFNSYRDFSNNERNQKKLQG